jgi:prepilin-type N-terminal cleavage/methylation domain-containing protein
MRNSFGFSLLEVMISLFILSFALFAYVELQQAAVRCNHSAYRYSLANQLLQNITEELRSSPDAAEEIKTWQHTVASALPKGEGKVIYTHAFYHLSIQWRDSLNDAYKISTIVML